MRVGDTEQRFPIAVATDCVLYASDDPNPVTACPAGLGLGDGLGQFGHYGTALVDEIAPLLPDPAKLVIWRVPSGWPRRSRGRARSQHVQSEF